MLSLKAGAKDITAHLKENKKETIFLSFYWLLTYNSSAIPCVFH